MWIEENNNISLAPKTTSCYNKLNSLELLKRIRMCIYKYPLIVHNALWYRTSGWATPTTIEQGQCKLTWPYRLMRWKQLYNHEDVVCNFCVQNNAIQVFIVHIIFYVTSQSGNAWRCCLYTYVQSIHSLIVSHYCTQHMLHWCPGQYSWA